MKIKKVNRYWCDFCNKAGLSASHMAKHEKHCTLNPARECRMCKMMKDGWDSDFKQATLPELIAILPPPDMVANENGGIEYHYTYQAKLDAAIPLLRKAAGGCPACMMAALRQAKIHVPMATGFDFTRECKEIWSGINEDRQYRQSVYEHY